MMYWMPVVIQHSRKATTTSSTTPNPMVRCFPVHFWELTLLLLLGILSTSVTSSFSMSMSSRKTIYDIPNSGWTSSRWNWGYAVGTGHDCALICRNRYNSRRAREGLIKDLCEAPSFDVQDRQPKNFEEVKLILALAWQRGRWDGSDGGRGGYGEILAIMSDATRYESQNEDENSMLLVNDMMVRFRLLAPSAEESKAMATLPELLTTDKDAARRKCSGLVLQAMRFVERGL